MNPDTLASRNSNIGRIIDLISLFFYCDELHGAMFSGRFDHLFYFLLGDGHVVAFLRMLNGYLNKFFFVMTIHGEVAWCGTLYLFHLLCHCCYLYDLNLYYSVTIRHVL